MENECCTSVPEAPLSSSKSHSSEVGVPVDWAAKDNEIADLCAEGSDTNYRGRGLDAVEHQDADRRRVAASIVRSPEGNGVTTRGSVAVGHRVSSSGFRPSPKFHSSRVGEPVDRSVNLTESPVFNSAVVEPKVGPRGDIDTVGAELRRVCSALSESVRVIDKQRDDIGTIRSAKIFVFEARSPRCRRQRSNSKNLDCPKSYRPM